MSRSENGGGRAKHAPTATCPSTITSRWRHTRNQAVRQYGCVLPVHRLGTMEPGVAPKTDAAALKMKGGGREGCDMFWARASYVFLVRGVWLRWLMINQKRGNETSAPGWRTHRFAIVACVRGPSF